MGSKPNHEFDRVLLPGEAGLYVLLYKDVEQIKIASKSQKLYPIGMHGQSQSYPEQGTDVFLKADSYRHAHEAAPFREMDNDYICIRRGDLKTLLALVPNALISKSTSVFWPSWQRARAIAGLL